MCSNAEHQAIDAVIDKGPVKAGAMDLKVVQGNHIHIVAVMESLFWIVMYCIVLVRSRQPVIFTFYSQFTIVKIIETAFKIHHILNTLVLVLGISLISVT